MRTLTSSASLMTRRLSHKIRAFIHQKSGLAFGKSRRCGEMADAQDLKFDFWRFQRVALNFNNCSLTIDSIGLNAFLPRQQRGLIQPVLVSQKVSQILKRQFQLKARPQRFSENKLSS